MKALKPLSDQVIVITGASSGMGLATGLEASKRGARVLLASRNGDALRDICRQINEDGGKAAWVAADVSRRDDVHKVANTAISQFGGFDTWINDAGLGIYGRVEDVTVEDARQLFDINFWGTVYGCLEAAGHLKTKGGALINLGSVSADVPLALHGYYSASKHAVKGFTDTLRIELKAENSPLSVTLIKPAAMGTPFFSHAKNYTSEEYEAPPPVYRPEEAVEAILHAATHRVRDIYVGGNAPVMAGMQRFLPGVMDWLQARDVSPESAETDGRVPDGNLYEPGPAGRVHGAPGGISVYTRAVTHPGVTAGAVAVLTAAGALALYAASRANGRGHFRKYF